ncbi:carbohydrate ABC transporter permease [Vallitalea pronyensis]|uniref:Carbohydrate ABC transporter permease n=1 Tax=Vallitalea pronyensis TaxID=1348613 RepID=A0A8J8SI70_9FIRM|nr:carbohydrate ABC transporter permease [Vallitalea pronyensis]QUI24610.1 carbohydrate ABC transporter permease [Vallitalea pronyensis]
MKKILSVLKYGLLVIYSAVSLYPLFWLLLYSFKDNEEILSTNPYGFPKVWRLENYVRAMTEFDLPLYFKNSLVVAFIAMFIGITVALLFGYAIARMKFKIASHLRLYVILGMFVPVQVYIIPLILQVNRLNLTGSLWSVIIPYIAMGLPFSILVLYGFYRGLPIELEESAFMDGASIFRTYYSIILPLMKPSIAALVIYQFMQFWNEFTLALLLLQDPELKTLPLGLSTFMGQFSTQWGPTGATLVIASTPVIIMYILFSDKVEKAMSVTSGIKG